MPSIYNSKMVDRIPSQVFPTRKRQKCLCWSRHCHSPPDDLDDATVAGNATSFTSTFTGSVVGTLCDGTLSIVQV